MLLWVRDKDSHEEVGLIMGEGDNREQKTRGKEGRGHVGGK